MTINWPDLISGVIILIGLYFGLDWFSKYLKKNKADSNTPETRSPKEQAPKKDLE